MEDRWLTIPELAEAAGISRQSAHEAASRGRWHGQQLKVRKRNGSRGGRGGQRYEVLLSSLPGPFQNAIMGPEEAGETVPASCDGPYVPRVASAAQGRRALALFEKIKSATGDLTSDQRGEAIRKIVEQTGMPLRTVQRHVGEYNKHGLEGLMRKRPGNAGELRCAVSAKFDRAFIAAGHPPHLLQELGPFVDQQIAGLWKSREADAGENDLRQLAGFLLWERCNELGITLPLDVCQMIGRRRIRSLRHFRVVNTRNNDAKSFRDLLPTIPRDWTPLDPMRLVVADVKHLDVLFCRPDGTAVYPKLIAFMDGGVGRIFPYLVLCPLRRSINQELVIEAFIAMCLDKEWGFPRQLYLDNGKEFGGLFKIIPAISLLNAQEGREIIKAKPYNAQAKPIEALFARLDRYCFSSMPGYTGGDRQKKKTQNDGKLPEPFEGTWEEFTQTVAGLIEYYHQRSIGGQWGGRSPNQWLQAKVNEGWKPTHPQQFALEMAFCERKTVKLGKHGIRYNAKRYWHPQFAALPGRGEIELLIPWRKDLDPIALLPTGPARLSEDMPFAANDTAGAIESGRRQQAYRRSTARLDRDAPTVDPVSVKLRMARHGDKIAIPGRRRFLDQGADIHELHRASRLLEQSPQLEIDQAARAREIEKRRTERLKRANRNGQ